MRRHFFLTSGLQRDARILEVGCGSGTLLEVLQADGWGNLAGIDKDFAALTLNSSALTTACADGLALPFEDGSFAACLCHFYLLWVADVLKALEEMKRVTQPGGWLAVLAEPDYGARIDRPESLEPLGKMQTQALKDQGADPCIGKKLPELLNQAGLVNIHHGELARQENTALSDQDWHMEWDVLQADLHGMLDDAELQHYKELDRAARQAGTRVLHVPVHYAFGQIPA